MLKRHSISLLLILVLTTTAFQCGGNLAGRAAKAVGAIPSVVRVLFPNADARILEAVDAAGLAFKQFVDDKSGSNWQRALNAWNTAKPLLARLSNARIQQIIAVVDILLSQVSIPASDMASAKDEKVRVDFDKARVEELEELVK